ncbi:uncharacterized protein METZ01_LOCUS405705, partial [marine metagenome]
PPGGRVQTIEPSPHKPGKAYVAVYRYMLDDWQPYIYKTEDYGLSWIRLTTGTNGIPADYPTRAIREDPDREGLLYAGTEFGMYISFDDGAHWQTFQLDLPATPITDIKVHRKDLVLSTMGRSFWIMDDISPLHQITEQQSRADAYLFQPTDVYRMRWSGARSVDDGAAPEYPPFGAIFYYYFADDAPDGNVMLEILDETGNLVRSYSTDSTATDTHPRGTPVLANNAGMHRFAWDLRYPGPIAVEEGANGGRGPMAVPGMYRVRLTAGSQSETRTFELKI